MKLEKILKKVALPIVAVGAIAAGALALKYNESKEAKEMLTRSLYSCAREERQVIKNIAFGYSVSNAKRYLKSSFCHLYDGESIAESGSLYITSPARHDGIREGSNFPHIIEDLKCHK